MMAAILANRTIILATLIVLDALSALAATDQTLARCKVISRVIIIAGRFSYAAAGNPGCGDAAFLFAPFFQHLPHDPFSDALYEHDLIS